MNPFSAIAIAYAKYVALEILNSLKNIAIAAAQTAYDKLWDDIYAAIEKAEKEFKSGAIKKDWVINIIVMKIKDAKKDKPITPRQERLLRRFLSWWVDQFIALLNKRFGQSWKTVAQDIRKKLGKEIPFID